jgi:hypothetical protein
VNINSACKQNKSLLLGRHQSDLPKSNLGHDGMVPVRAQDISYVGGYPNRLTLICRFSAPGFLPEARPEGQLLNTLLTMLAY